MSNLSEYEQELQALATLYSSVAKDSRGIRRTLMIGKQEGVLVALSLFQARPYGDVLDEFQDRQLARAGA